MMTREQIEAIAEYTEWLADQGMVIAVRRNVSDGGTGWRPITPTEGDVLATRFMEAFVG